MILFVGLALAPSIASKVDRDGAFLTSTNGNILYVGGSGEGNYSTIQEAINNATNGDTVFVYNDSSPYYERILIYKSIYLIGEDKHSTVIDANKQGSPIRITTDGCLVSGFTIQNCKKVNNYYDSAPVQICSSKNVTIKDNIVTIGDMEYHDSVAAIDLYKSTYNTIQDNYIYEENRKGRSYGIVLREESTYNTISGNNISNYVSGVKLLSNGCCNNIISENHIHHNSDGVEILYVSYTEIINNTIQYNSGDGIYNKDAHYTTISGNIISHNGEGSEFDSGITLIDGSNNYISDNIISKNNPAGLQIILSHDNVITRNNFIDNYGEEGTPERWWGNAYFYYSLKFFKVNDWKGNYWSDSTTGGLFLKIIRGDVVFFSIFWGLYRVGIRWINFDWRPAREPYEIEYNLDE